MNTAPGFLLTMPDYGGTLAAVRCLGARGVPVYVAYSQLLAPAAWSRHVAERFPCPPPRPASALLEWLFDFGRRRPGQVLYATSDDLAWLLAVHEKELGRYYRLYAPPSEVMLRVLDKKAMYEAAAAAGIATPTTEFPGNDAELERAVRRLPHPVLIKPRTQAHLSSLLKGEVVADPRDTVARYRAFMSQNRYDDAIVRHLADVSRPMLQRYTPEAARSIYSLSGFCDETGDSFTVRAAVKVLQWPRRVGVGICFEDAPVDEQLAERLRQFCLQVGYFGVFEAEFVRDGSGLRLIDFNPTLLRPDGLRRCAGVAVRIPRLSGSAGRPAWACPGR